LVPARTHSTQCSCVRCTLFWTTCQDGTAQGGHAGNVSNCMNNIMAPDDDLVAKPETDAYRASLEHDKYLRKIFLWKSAWVGTFYDAGCNTGVPSVLRKAMWAMSHRFWQIRCHRSISD